MRGVKHTPGPWRHDGQGDITGVEIDPDDGCAVEWDICSVYLRTAHGRHDANARLIAAAPDLLSSLIDIYAAYCNVMHSEFDFPGRPWTPERDNDLTAINARAAITKATGKTS